MTERTPRKIKSLTELGALSEEFLQYLVKLPSSDRATVVGLSGDFGSGKTAFVKCVAVALGIVDIVTSPTFILEKVYIIPSGSLADRRFTKLIHIDAYRLEGGIEMMALDWEALLAGERNIIFLEWPEQVVDAMPKDIIKMSFAYVSERVRQINF